MRIILLLIAVMLLMTGADARYSPGLEIAEGENITLAGGWINDASMSIGAIPETYGAVGDGITDDTNALKWAIQNNSKTILIPGHEYKVSAPINPASWKGKTLIGYGATIVLANDITPITISEENVTIEGVTIKENESYIGPAMRFAATHHRLTTRDVTILCNYIDTINAGSWEGVRITGRGHGTRHYNLKIFNPNVGLNITAEGSGWVSDEIFDDLVVQTANRAVVLSGEVTGNVFNSPSVINCISAGAIGFDFQNKSNYNTISNPIIWWDGDRAGEYTAIKTDATTSRNLVIGGHIEGYINDSGANYIDGVALADGHAAPYVDFNGFFSNVGTYNHVVNGNFESDTSSWTAGSNAVLSSNAIYSKFGQKSLKVTGNGGAGEAYAMQTVPAPGPGNEWVTFGAWCMAPVTNTGGHVYIFMSDAISKTKTSAVVPADGNWYWRSITLDASAVTSGNINLNLYADFADGSTDVAYFDGVQLVDGSVCSSQFMPHFTAA